MRKKIWWIVVLSIFVLSGVMGYVMARNAPDISGKSTSVAADNEHVTLSSKFVYTYEYVRCGHAKTLNEDAKMDYIGLNRAQLESKLEGFVVVGFSAETIKLRRSLQCYCADHLTAKLEGDKLVLWRTAPFSDEQTRVGERSIDTAKLTAEEREAFGVGRVFAGEEELDSLLDR